MVCVVHQWERLRIPGVAQLIRQDIPAVPTCWWRAVRGLLEGRWSPVYAGSPKKRGLILGKEIHSKRIDTLVKRTESKQAKRKDSISHVLSSGLFHIGKYTNISIYWWCWPHLEWVFPPLIVQSRKSLTGVSTQQLPLWFIPDPAKLKTINASSR